MILNQLLDITLTCNYICKVQLGKLDLAGRILKLALLYDPVVKRSVILKFQCTDGMGNMLNGVLNGMGKIIHGVNAPLISRIVMLHMSHTINNRVSHVDIG